jgi:hypothetical protein
MLGTGTAWVLNGKSAQLFYDESLMTHPGRDILPGSYGYIIGLGTLGEKFGAMCRKFSITRDDLNEIYGRIVTLTDNGFDAEWNALNLSEIASKINIVKHHLDKSAACVAATVAKLQKHNVINKITITGGAANIGYLPSVIAKLCGMPVEVIEFPEFAAYGAALLAMTAATGRAIVHKHKCVDSIVYEPMSLPVNKEWCYKFRQSMLNFQTHVGMATTGDANNGE